MELTSLDKHMKNLYKWNNAHRITTESSQMFSSATEAEKISPCNWVGQNGGKNESRWDLHPWEGAMKEERCPCPGNILHWLRGPLGHIGSWSGLEFAEEEGVGAGLLPHMVERD